jgi:hypothetical protein
MLHVSRPSIRVVIVQAKLGSDLEDASWSLVKLRHYESCDLLSHTFFSSPTGRKKGKEEIILIISQNP